MTEFALGVDAVRGRQRAQEVRQGAGERVAVRRVKMVLTGDGGDELFAGYEKYLNTFPEGRTDGLQANWEDEFVRA